MTVQDIRAAFEQAKSQNRVAFIPYVTAGFPEKNATVNHLLSLQKGGADIIELGVPFSDPVADGPTIQMANQIALEGGVNVRECLEFVKKSRSCGLTIPVILMGYFNPFLQYGEGLVADCADASISGFIVVDLTGPEREEFARKCLVNNLAFIPLVSPTSTEARISEISSFCSGYVYCVSVAGVTGVRSELPEDLSSIVERIKKHFDLPVAVGFGLSTRKHVKELYQYAEGAVMGSIIIKTIENAGSSPDVQNTALEAFVKKVTTD